MPSPLTGAAPGHPAVGVVLVSRSRLLVEGLSAALADEAQVQVLTAGDDIAQTLDALGRISELPDVLVVEHQDAAGADLAGVRAFQHAYPQAQIVIMSLPTDPPTIVAYVDAGVRGLLTSDADLQHLVSSIHLVAQGQAACSPWITTVLLESVAGATPRSLDPDSPSLTTRERQIAELLERGLSNKEIARQLDIALATVKNHVHHILTKLDLDNRGRVRTAMRPDPLAHNGSRRSANRI